MARSLQDKELRATVGRAVDSSPSLRNKKDLIDAFIDSLTVSADVDTGWKAFVAARAGEELDRVIRDEGLDPVGTRAFMASAFRDGAIAVTGTAITTIMPPRSRFSPDSDHAAKKQTVLAKLAAYLDRFLGLL